MLELWLCSALKCVTYRASKRWVGGALAVKWKEVGEHLVKQPAQSANPRLMVVYAVGALVGLVHYLCRAVSWGEHRQPALVDRVRSRCRRECAHVRIRGGIRHEVALEHVAFAEAVRGEPSPPRAPLLPRAAGESAVVVAVGNRFG